MTRAVRRLVSGGAAGAALALASCGAPDDPLAARGTQVYQAQCTQCHSPDPAQPGPVGPAVKGASSALLEAKMVRGTYPPGYRPQRPTSAMPPMPQLAGEVEALAAYLK